MATMTLGRIERVAGGLRGHIAECIDEGELAGAAALVDQFEAEALEAVRCEADRLDELIVARRTALQGAA